VIGDPAAIEAFIRENTQIVSPPLVPELRLRLATEMVPIWQASETTLEEIGIEPPYWAFCWPGSQALARLLLDEPERVAGRRVLDFAAGSGLAAIAAARSGATGIANEIDPVAMAAIVMNAALNDVSVALEPGDLTASHQGRWDVVLAGDVCYQRGMAERAVAWLRGLAAAGSEVLLADPGRSYLPAHGLEAVARYTVPTSLDLEDRVNRECVVWRVQP